MDSKEAFDLLLAEVGAAVEDSLARYTTAVQKGEVDAMELEQERQRNLLATRNQLEVLQGMWVGLVGVKRTPRKPPTKRRRASRERPPVGNITQVEDYVLPILYVLEQLGGSGETGDVVDRVGEFMADCLTERDRQPLESGEIRWQNYVRWARKDMKEEGLLKEDSPYGLWEISRKGEAHLREHRRELSGSKRPSLPRGGKQTSPGKSSRLGEVPAKGLAVYARFKGQRYEATLYPDGRVRYSGKEYGSPSGAGKAAIGYKTLNGWKFWRYLDDQGDEHYITDLRD
jgi:hypothetical protein